MGGTLSVDKIIGASGFDLEVGGQTPFSVDSSGNVTLGGGTLIGSRNRIINGAMAVAQRGTNFVSLANTGYSVDRFRVDYAMGGAVTVSQQTDVPASQGLQYSLRLAVTTADASIAASDYYAVQQIVEGYNVSDLVGKTFTLSFWVRSSKTGTHCVSIRNSNSDRSYVAPYTITTANTWEYHTITIVGGLPTAGTWNFTNGAGLQIGWILASGSTFVTGSPNSWQSANVFSTSAQVNCLDTVGNIFALAGLQLEVGAVSTPFEMRPIGLEILLCQRYFMGGIGVVTGGGSTPTAVNRSYYCMVNFPVSMRTTPTMTLANVDTNTNMNSPSWSGVTPSRGWFSTLNTLTNDAAYVAQYTANAEL